MDQVEFPAVLQFFKALAHESRLRLLGLVAQREHNVQELAQALGLTEPTASHHLAMLRGLGLVRLRVAGNTHWYGLDSEALTGLARAVLSREQVAALAPQAGGVLRNFISDAGVITQIPASRKKRWVVLAWLVEKFEAGRGYSEAEVNAVIQRHHEDCATLRRELVGYRMMAREAGVYRRLAEADWLGV